MVQSMSTAQHSTAQHSTAQHSTAHYDVISSVFCQPLKQAFSHFSEKTFLCENESEVAYA
ncbi:hypothetical protein SAMN05216373_0090 [Streptococcus equinus]|nr:hypothetical protein SAMN05216373_0090 [Streptococcus equinus]